MDVNEELKFFFVKIHTKKIRGVGRGSGGGSGWWGVRVDVNEELKFFTKKVLYNIKKMKKNVWGEGGGQPEPKTLSMYLKKEKEKKVKNKK